MNEKGGALIGRTCVCVCGVYVFKIKKKENIDWIGGRVVFKIEGRSREGRGDGMDWA